MFVQGFGGNRDNSDLLSVKALAARRGLILVDNAGVGLSTGAVPRTVAEMARRAIASLGTLELTEIDCSS